MKTLGAIALGFVVYLAVASAAPVPVTPDYPIAAVPHTGVRLTDKFWQAKVETNRTVSIPHIMRQNEITNRVLNFLKAAGKAKGAYEGQRYNDTDIYKVIEAASYSLAAHPDPALDAKLDELIAIVAAAQEPDGYLYTPRTVDASNPPPGIGPSRWSYLHTSHELYAQGHMYEAAVAHFQATGKRTFLDVAIKSADLVCRTFGPTRRRDVPGHEEIELALVKLYRATGDRKYLEQARFFLDERGRTHNVEHATFPPGDRFFMYNDRSYRQDHAPLVEQTRAIGHAVRATYLYTGMTDVATLAGHPGYANTVATIFNDVVGKRMYITGGLGSVGSTEAFGDDYALPNRTASTETCASIGGLLWYHRMFLRTGDAQYLDVFERTLYNAYLAGVSVSGDTFFYQNPLESAGTEPSAQRSAYFDVACCPANLARLMAQMPGLIYAQKPAPSPEIFVNLFVGSETTFNFAERTVRVSQQTNYPWKGDITLRVDPDRTAAFGVSIRIPGWARSRPVPSDLYTFATTDAGEAANANAAVTINGAPVKITLEKGFLRINRRWTKGDVVQITLPMYPRRVLANDNVVENRGKAAIQRGPLVYCLEGVDNNGKSSDIAIPINAPLLHDFRADLLGGIEVIHGRGFMAIPYYAWANRGRGDMTVWVGIK